MSRNFLFSKNKEPYYWFTMNDKEGINYYTNQKIRLDKVCAKKSLQYDNILADNFVPNGLNLKCFFFSLTILFL